MVKTRSLLAGGIALGAVTLLAAPAAAHVTIQEREQRAGAYTVLTFGVPHGCDGSPTNVVEISIPEPILQVTPTRHPFYDVTVETETLDEPVEGPHGEQITEREAVVVYTATDPLPDDLRDALQISLRVPEEAAGETLYFPTVQTCDEGEAAWIQIPADGQDPHDLEYPAPRITVAEGAGGHGSAPEDADGAEGEGASTEVDRHDDGDEQAVDGALTSSGDHGTDPLAVIALIVGALGLVAGAAGFATARRGTR